jgi:hypothetical protein
MTAHCLWITQSMFIHPQHKQHEIHIWLQMFPRAAKKESASLSHFSPTSDWGNKTGGTFFYQITKIAHKKSCHSTTIIIISKANWNGYFVLLALHVFNLHLPAFLIFMFSQVWFWVTSLMCIDLIWMRKIISNFYFPKSKFPAQIATQPKRWFSAMHELK